MSTAMRSRVVLVLTGGTIDRLGKSRLDLVSYADEGRRLTSRELLARIPELRSIADLDVRPFASLPSIAMTSADWFRIATLVQAALDDTDVSGVVVTHGTNTLEETAYFLHLTLNSSKPTVIVGAMRPASALSSDGDLNLTNAVAVAASPEARGMGVLVVMNDTIHAARDVTKAATLRVNAFESRAHGPLGFADSDRNIVFYRHPVRGHSLESELGTPQKSIGGIDLPRVDVVVSYLGADGVMISAAVAAGAKGIVCAGTGAGMISPDEHRALQEASTQGVVICMSTRVGSGRVVRTRSLAAEGIIVADDLVPWKARILLSLVLRVTSDPARIQSIFDRY